MATNIRKASEARMINVSISLGDGYVKQNGEASVYIITYLKGKKIKFNTGISIHLDHWDPGANRIKSTVKGAKDYNLIIANCISRINDIFVRFRLQHVEITPQVLKKEYHNPTRFIDFYTFMESAIKEREGELTVSSMVQHRAVMFKLKEFKPQLSFAEVDADFLKKFNRWMINTRKNSQNTRHNTFKTLKAYFNIAIDKKIITSNPLNKLPFSRETTNPVWLTEAELKGLISLYEQNYVPAAHQRALRHFLFSCFTGLRISDVKNLQITDIIGDTIVLIPYKTKNRNSKTAKIPLTRYAKKLIKDESPHRVRGPVFYMLSEQKTREYLKQAVAVKKINKNISFHSGRHTFATLFLRKTKNIIALQKLLGHSRVTETMIYTHILTEEIEDEMKNAFGCF
jgi:integrase/recombinase XerD